MRASQRLPGALYATRLKAGQGWYAIGVATDQAVKFQGFHARNMLIIFDEASGIPGPIWTAAEAVAVAENNRTLAIGNPLAAEGRFYQLFRDHSGWCKLTISALEHPNITGKGPPIEGALTISYLEDRIADWCEPVPSPSPVLGRGGQGVRAREGPRGSPTESPPCSASEGRLAEGLPAGGFIPPVAATPDTFSYRGITYRPNNLFRARVLAQFPDAGDETLIPLRWIEAAAERQLPATGIVRVAADVARYGDDNTVIGTRVGPVVKTFDVLHGIDTMTIAGKLRQLAFDHHPSAIAVDSIGIGAGVVDRLIELGVEGVDPVNVAKPPYDPERFANRRAELYWGLRERFRSGDIDIPKDERLIQELAAVRYIINSRGQIQIESKDAMKRRAQTSPDRADMLALLYGGAADCLFATNPTAIYIPASPQAQMRAEMRNW